MQAPRESSETSEQVFVRWLNKGIAHHRAGRSEEALFAYRQALKYKPRHDFTFACLADVLNSLGRYEEALVASIYATDLNPTCALAYFSEVEAMTNLHLHEEALRACERAIALTRSEAAYTLKADILTELQRNQEALNTYARALQLNPRGAAIYNNLGILLTRMQRHEAAQRSFAQAIQLDPDVAIFYTNLSHLLEELGKREEAAQAQTMAKELSLQEAGTLILKVAEAETPWEDMATISLPSPRLFRSREQTRYGSNFLPGRSIHNQISTDLTPNAPSSLLSFTL